MALVVRNTDIINNTGITLANPTGVAGTYALRNQPNITSYSWDTATINGELFTGKIVTVGSGKDYSTFYAAFVAQLSDPDDVLMLVDAGTYAEWPSDVAPVLTNKKLYIRGMGSSAANTLVKNRNGRSEMLGFSTGCTIIIENIYIWCNGGGRRYAVGLFNNANVIVNKSYLDGLAYSPGSHCLCASSFSGYGFISNTKMNRADYHISGLLYAPTTAESLEHIYLDKVELTQELMIWPYYPAQPESDLRPYLALNDHVTTPTEGYGYNYGNFLILPASPIIDRHDLSWGGGTAQPVTEDGVYTLSDGSNNQKLILNFDGAEGATTYINDVTGEAIELSSLQQEGCSIDTSWKKFGVGSLKVTAGGYLYVEGLSPNTGDITLHSVLKVVQELSIGTSPFYIELTSTVTGDILSFLRFNFDSEGPLGGGAICYFSYYDYANETYHDSDYFEGLAVGSDSHIAMVIDGATVRGFVDGTKVWEYTHTGLITGFDIFDLRLVDGGQVNIDAVEITDEALWTENFTPPTSAPSIETGNTIEATVDYSALAAEDTTDNVRVTGAVYISITPYMKRISAGQTQQFTATMIDNEGSAVDVTNEVVWASSDTDIATINSSGLATGLAEGDVTISATMS